MKGGINMSDKKKNNNDKTIYTVGEVAEKLRVHPQTVRNLIHNRKMEAIKIGNEFRIFKKDYERFVKRNSTDF